MGRPPAERAVLLGAMPTLYVGMFPWGMNMATQT